MHYYRAVRDDSETISKLIELSENHPTEGQDLYYSRIRQQGLLWNYKRVRRIYLLLGMKTCTGQGKSTTCSTKKTR